MSGADPTPTPTPEPGAARQPNTTRTGLMRALEGPEVTALRAEIARLASDLAASRKEVERFQPLIDVMLELDADENVTLGIVGGAKGAAYISRISSALGALRAAGGEALP